VSHAVPRPCCNVWWVSVLCVDVVPGLDLTSLQDPLQAAEGVCTARAASLEQELGDISALGQQGRLTTQQVAQLHETVRYLRGLEQSVMLQARYVRGWA
jgi:hypothetical protein